MPSPEETPEAKPAVLPSTAPALRGGAVLTDVVCVSTSQVASRVGDEVAILDLDHSEYYGLDPVGARIWELIQEPAPLTTVLETMLAEFEVDADTARADLLALIDQLVAKGLVEVRASDAA